MKKIKRRLMLAKDDYDIIMSYVRKRPASVTFNRRDAEELEGELKRAKVVDKEDLPGDVVRLNSTVTIKEEKENKIMELMVVIPEKADIRQKRISVMSPVGTALIGFGKGHKVKWRVPAGNKTFTIMEVQNLYA
jgi:regulator of nucleoside diphosphate kinase